MHEASIVDRLVGMVVERAPARTRVTRVHVRVGALAGASPDALQFYFEALRGERLGEQAELRIECAPLRAQCAGCGEEWEFQELKWECPGCGAARLEFRSGHELDLVAIEVEDVGDDPDRREDPGQERRPGCPEPAPAG